MWRQYTSLVALACFMLATAHASLMDRTLTERVFLANCGSYAPSWTKSQVGYFDNNAEEIENQQPTAVFDWGSVVFWEGNNVTATLSNGDIFTSQIHADAANQAVWAAVGTGISSSEVWECSKRWGAQEGFPEGWVQDSGEVCFVLYECATS